MKKFLAISALLAFSGPLFAQEAPATACPASECAKTACNTPKCNLACDCTGNSLIFAVTGLEDEEKAIEATASINILDSAVVCEACTKKGSFVVNFDPAKVQPATLEKALTDSGLVITGQKVSLKVTGMTCGGCSKQLNTILAKTEGVTKVDKVCHTSGKVLVTFDPKKTDGKKIEAAVSATKYVVAKKTTPQPAS